MINEKIWNRFYPYVYDEIINVKKRAEEIKNACEFSQNINKKYLNEMDFETLSRMTFCAEKTALSLRYAMNECDKEMQISKGYLGNEESNVSVKFEDDILIIHTPFLFKRGQRKDNTKYNYLMSNYVRLALENWKKENKIDNLKEILSVPMTVFFVRRAEKYNRKYHCDADNLEVSSIINEIFAYETGYCDNALNMDFYSAFRIEKDVKKQGNDIYFVKRKDFIKGVLKAEL